MSHGRPAARDETTARATERPVPRGVQLRTRQNPYEIRCVDGKDVKNSSRNCRQSPVACALLKRKVPEVGKNQGNLSLRVQQKFLFLLADWQNESRDFGRGFCVYGVAAAKTWPRSSMAIRLPGICSAPQTRPGRFAPLPPDSETASCPHP